MADNKTTIIPNERKKKQSKNKRKQHFDEFH